MVGCLVVSGGSMQSFQAIAYCVLVRRAIDLAQSWSNKKAARLQ